MQSAAHLFVPAFCTEAHDIGHFLAAPSLHCRQLCRLGGLLPHKALNNSPNVPPGLHQWRHCLQEDVPWWLYRAMAGRRQTQACMCSVT